MKLQFLMKNLAKRPCSDAPALWLMIPFHPFPAEGMFHGAECPQSPHFHVWRLYQLTVIGQKPPGWSPSLRLFQVTHS